VSGRDTYLGRDYGSHARQAQERDERLGLRVAPEDQQAADWQQDLQDDLEAERRGIDAPLALTSGPSVSGREMATRVPGRVEDDRCGRQAQPARTTNTTNLRKRAA
jgi:hypothetical protein